MTWYNENGIKKWGDLFCGGGGATTGAFSVPGVHVVWALNHSKNAIATHSLNHPETKHYRADIREQDEHELEEVFGIWMSSECTNFTRAKGGKTLDFGSRTLPNELFRYAQHTNAQVLIVENVREFLEWGPIDDNGRPINSLKGQHYKEWVATLQNMGFDHYDYRVLDSADYGAYTSRKRYFGIFTRGIPIQWPSQTHSKSGDGFKPWRACKDKLEMNNKGRSIFDRKEPLCVNTLKRIAAGIKKYANYDITADDLLDEFYRRKITTKVMPSEEIIDIAFLTRQNNSSGRPDTQHQNIISPIGTITTTNHYSLVHFIAKTYSSAGHPEYNIQSIEEPAGTITTKDRFAFTTFESKKQAPSLSDIDVYSRYITSEEAKRLQGFPEAYVLTGTHAERLRLVGNSVVPHMAKLLIGTVSEAAVVLL